VPLLVDDRYLPVTLTTGSMTDAEFVSLCTQYPDCFLELTADGEVVITPPNYTSHGARSGVIGAQLRDWSNGNRLGAVTNCTGGFRLPNGALRAPDVGWTLKRRIYELSDQSQRAFWHLCPDFVVELRSHTDRPPVLRAKMQEWIDNGARLAWLIDPEREAVEVYRSRQAPETRIGIESIAGEGPVEGFVLDLRRVWDPLAD
jgi:Uma2 family endonuclease